MDLQHENPNPGAPKLPTSEADMVAFMAEVAGTEVAARIAEMLNTSEHVNDPMRDSMLNALLPLASGIAQTASSGDFDLNEAQPALAFLATPTQVMASNVDIAGALGDSDFFSIPPGVDPKHLWVPINDFIKSEDTAGVAMFTTLKRAGREMLTEWLSLLEKTKAENDLHLPIFVAITNALPVEGDDTSVMSGGMLLICSIPRVVLNIARAVKMDAKATAPSSASLN